MMPMRWPMPQVSRAVDRPDAEVERLGDGLALHGAERQGIEAFLVGEIEWRPLIERLAHAVEYPAEQASPTLMVACSFLTRI
jgi:hypothetical protein